MIRRTHSPLHAAREQDQTEPGQAAEEMGQLHQRERNKILDEMEPAVRRRTTAR